MFLGVAFVCLLYYVPKLFISNNVEQTADLKKELETEKIKNNIKDLVEKYSAVTNWEEGNKYTVELQNKLMVGKPVLFEGQVDDVYMKDGNTYVLFGSLFLSDFNYTLKMECNNSEVINKIMEHKPESKDYSFFENYAVVADVYEIIKPIYSISASGEDQVETESSDRFILSGKCVDISYVGDIEISDMIQK